VAASPRHVPEAGALRAVSTRHGPLRSEFPHSASLGAFSGREGEADAVCHLVVLLNRRFADDVYPTFTVVSSVPRLFVRRNFAP
jgi:hypothetical protein